MPLFRLVAFHFALFFALGAHAQVLPLHTGDINDDGVRNVADMTCLIAGFLANGVAPLSNVGNPDCQAFSDEDSDLDCNEAIDIVDIQRGLILSLHVLNPSDVTESAVQDGDFDADFLTDACDTDDDNDNFSDVCEWNQGTDPLDASDTPAPGACECVPNCNLKTCGGDGCGGSCGSCDTGYECNTAGTCDCIPQCNGKECGEDSCGGNCGTCGTGFECNTTGTCDCAPQCDGKTCGGDGCGGSCGACQAGHECNSSGTCDCVPQCDGKDCGGDSCGGDCGSCDTGYECNSGGTCDCVPQCDGKICGEDTCGGVCGACDAGYECIAGIACECVPDCSGKTCGGDGCGGSCGTCSGELVCDQQDGFCREEVTFDEIHPIYQSKCAICHTLGSSGGFSIGDSDVNFAYAESQKTAYSINGTKGGATIVRIQSGSMPQSKGCSGDPLLDAVNPSCLVEEEQAIIQDWIDDGQLPPICVPVCVGKACGSDGCGGSCGECEEGSQCVGFGFCMCIQQCVGKTCGPDGCGGTCGACDPGLDCNADGTCECIPDCSGKDCGGDGCGGSCGSCTGGLVCDQQDSICREEVTFDQVHPIYQSKCAQCHGAGSSGGFSIANSDLIFAYQESQKNSYSINGTKGGATIVRIQSGSMPLGKGCSGDPLLDAVNPSCLVEEEQAIIQDWIDDGELPPVCIPDCSGKTCGGDGCGGSCGSCGDGDACNGTETCVGGNCAGGSPVVCDDGDACNGVEACQEGECLNVQPALDCDDDNACTDDSCSGGACQNDNNSAGCNDGDACSIDDSCSGGVCVAGDPKDCDDDDICTDDACGADGLCDYTPSNAPGCTSPPTGDNVFCEVSGPAGVEVLCPIQMARATENGPGPAAAQFDVLYDPNDLTVLGMVAETCLPLPPGVPPVCIEVPVPPASLSTGHSVLLNPANYGDWDGFGKVLLANPSDASALLTEAFQTTPGTFSGDTLVMSLKLEINTPIDAGAPSLLTFDNTLGSTADANDLPAVVVNQVIVMGEEDGGETGSEEGGTNGCTPADCDDGNACTTDVCQLDACLYFTIECNDGDNCNGVENCDVDTGCFVEDPPPACDDGDDCNGVETCDNGVCVEGLPVPCDDGDPCTDDGCAGGDCEYTPNDAPGCDVAVEGVVCSLSGSSGETVSCFLQLARASEDSSEPSGIQFNLSWSELAVKIDNFYDAICFDFINSFENCTPGLGFVLAVAGPGAQSLYPSGHTISTVPSDPAQWSSPQGFLMTNVSNPQAILTAAYLDAAGEVVGDSEFVEIRFLLNESVLPGDANGHVIITDVSASNAIPIGINGDVLDGVIIVSDP
jgi:hypothetical protein